MIDRAGWLSWTEGLDDEAARNALVMLVSLGLAEAVPDFVTAGALATLHEGLPYTSRLQVSAAHDSRWAVRELLDDDRLGSAVVVVDRPIGSLRRRPWRWPLRISTLGLLPERFEAVGRELAAAANRFPPELVQLARAEDEPGATDVLIVPGSLHEATVAVIGSGVVANAVVVLEKADRQWALTLAQAASIRAATSAGVVALADPSGRRPLGDSLGQIVWEMSHAQPIDVALTRAFDRRILVLAEAEALDRSKLQEVARRLVREVAMAERPPTAEPPPPSPPTRGGEVAEEAEAGFPEAGLLADAAEGMFLGEVHEASTIAGAAPRVVEAIEEAGGDRRLQALVTSPGAQDNTLREGADHGVMVWIGPVEAGALATDVAFPDEELPWDEAEAFRLTVVFAPTSPIAEPQRAELELRRTGRAGASRSVWRVPAGLTSAEARIVVLFRNRVLQTAVLSGDAGGELVLREWVGLRQRMGDLDDRQPFDAALVLNHAADGTKRLIGNAAGHASVADGADITPIADRLAAKLEGAVALKRPKKLGAGAVKLLAELAIDGHDLFETLGESTAGVVAGAHRIQIVRMRADWVFPLEMTYDRPAPKLTAKLCPTFEAGAASCDRLPQQRLDRLRLSQRVLGPEQVDRTPAPRPQGRGPGRLGVPRGVRADPGPSRHPRHVRRLRRRQPGAGCGPGQGGRRPGRRRRPPQHVGRVAGGVGGQGVRPARAPAPHRLQPAQPVHREPGRAAASTDRGAVRHRWPPGPEADGGALRVRDGGDGRRSRPGSPCGS